MNLSALHRVLERGTAAVDWCESNYKLHPDIAEFANTVSNVVFLIFSPILICLFRNYARNVSRGIYLIWLLFAIVGLSSAHFHATLSLFGQLLDELSILWLLSAASAMWLPRKCYPSLFNGSRSHFRQTVFWSSVLLTACACLQPQINSFVLVSMGLPIFCLLFQEIKWCTDSRVRRLGVHCTCAWLVAMFCWLSDRLFCDHWLELGMDYLHALFHVSISYTSVALCSLFAFFDAVIEYPEKGPTLRFWPNDDTGIGLPYVILNPGL